MANLNKVPNVDLIVGLYRMNGSNTPKIGTELDHNSIDFIPEAHCYLKINNERIDFTDSTTDFKKIEPDIIIEKSIKPEQVSEFKVNYHKQFLRKWIEQNEIGFDFDQIWRIREKCIENLSE